MAKKPKRRRPGRKCRTEGCPGVVKELKRKNNASYIKRRFCCRLCRLRWSSFERDHLGTIETDGPHGTKAAAKRLAEWLEKQGSNPPVAPTPRDLFSSLE